MHSIHSVVSVMDGITSYIHEGYVTKTLRLLDDNLQYLQYDNDLTRYESYGSDR